MQVVDGQHERARLRRPREKCRDGLEETEALLGAGHVRSGTGRRAGQQRRETREIVITPSAGVRRRRQPTDDLDPGPERRRTGAFIAAPAVDVAFADLRGEALYQRRLAGARAAFDQQNAARAAARVPPRAVEHRERVGPADERDPRPLRRGRTIVRAAGRGAHEAKAPAAHRADETLCRAVVAQRAARAVDRRAERAVADEDARPQGGEQLVARDGTVAVANEVAQQLERLLLDLDLDAGSPQLAAAGVNLEIVEPIHLRPGVICGRVAGARDASHGRLA